eukprot:1138781-Pelagomonas_calceolata.AAC.5
MQFAFWSCLGTPACVSGQLLNPAVLVTNWLDRLAVRPVLTKGLISFVPCYLVVPGWQASTTCWTTRP